MDPTKPSLAFTGIRSRYFLFRFTTKEEKHNTIAKTNKEDEDLTKDEYDE